MNTNLLIVSIISAFVLPVWPSLALDASEQLQTSAISSYPTYRPFIKPRRSADHGHSHNIIHSHMARKVFDRACAASKDTIDEIINCMTNNEMLVKAIDAKLAAGCYKESFGQEFDHSDVKKHKEMICNNREKFEGMTACIYRKTAESMDKAEFDKLTEAMVDVGMCIINAIDG